MVVDFCSLQMDWKKGVRAVVELGIGRKLRGTLRLWMVIPFGVPDDEFQTSRHRALAILLPKAFEEQTTVTRELVFFSKKPFFSLGWEGDFCLVEDGCLGFL